MNKLFKGIIIITTLLVMILTLAGCGNKLVATKTTEETNTDGEVMKYDEKMQIYFKNNTVSSVKTEYEFQSEDDANTIKAGFELIKAFVSDFNIEINQKGKKLTIELDKEAFETLQDLDESSLTKEAIKTELEKNGYKVK